jgi:hypothetical protein
MKVAMIVFLLGVQFGHWLTIYGLAQLLKFLRSKKDKDLYKTSRPALPG